jgi:hypothetical protein
MHVKNLIWETSPLIIHAPGLHHAGKRSFIHMSVNPYWIPIMKNWEKTAPVSAGNSTKKELTIITWNTTSVKGCCEASLEKLGLDYFCLGKNIKKWRFIDKITTALEMIDSIKTPYVMALDCFDVIVLRDPHEAVEKFKAMHCDMLINGEKNYHPDFGIMTTGKYAITDQWKEYEKSIAQSDRKHLNAGAVIAKTPFYKEFLIKSLERHEAIKKNQESFPLPRDPVYKKYPDYKISDDDQMIAHWIYHDDYPRMMIDYRMEIFFNTVHTSLDKNKIVIEDNVFGGWPALAYRIKVSILSVLWGVYFALPKILILPAILKNYFHNKSQSRDR